MDPITQGVLGATAGQVVADRRTKRSAAVVGFLAGMAADLDVLIRSDTDPMLALEYHRHFTHALVFIPIGALICAWVFYRFLHWRAKNQSRRDRLSFKQIYLFSFAGYATHALLDACTTYGTQLLWPFSNIRVAWNTVSVIDPAFTFPLLALLLLAIFGNPVNSRDKPATYARLAPFLPVVYVFFYLGLGYLQNMRAMSAAQELAAMRGHTAIKLGVKPSFANIVVFKSVYEHQGRFYVDAIRVARKIEIIEGTSTQRLNSNLHFPWLVPESQQAKDLLRFAWFSNEHLAIDPDNPLKVLDIRYSQLPNRLDGMWGIALDPSASVNKHAVWVTSRPDPAQARGSLAVLWSMVTGTHSALRSIEDLNALGG